MTRARAVLIAMLALMALLSWRTIEDVDFGIHMASGRWIAENGRVPSTDPFTWTVADHDYVAYHWLFQVALYGSDQLLGGWGPTALRFILLLATFLLLADILRMRGAEPVLIAPCALLAILGSETLRNASG